MNHALLLVEEQLVCEHSIVEMDWSVETDFPVVLPVVNCYIYSTDISLSCSISASEPDFGPATREFQTLREDSTHSPCASPGSLLLSGFYYQKYISCKKIQVVSAYCTGVQNGYTGCDSGC